MDSAYDLFTRGTALLEDGDFHAAAVPLARARDLEPDKDSVREALGRALFRAQRYERGAPRSSRRSSSTRRPTTTRCSASAARCSCSAATREARQPLALARNLRPERGDYREVPRPAPAGALPSAAAAATTAALDAASPSSAVEPRRASARRRGSSPSHPHRAGARDAA